MTKVILVKWTSIDIVMLPSRYIKRGDILRTKVQSTYKPNRVNLMTDP